MKIFLIIPCFLSYMFLPLAVGKDLAEDLREWTTAYSLTGERELVDNQLLATLPLMTKEWKVSLEIKPTDYSFTSYANVLHMTIGGKGLGSGSKVGDRTPAIWIHKNRGVMVSSALNGKAAYTKTFKHIPPAGEWTNIAVSQTLMGSKYFYTISIANQDVHNVENKKPVELSDVKVYAGSPWYTARKGFLQNLRVEIKVPKPLGTNCLYAGAWLTAFTRQEEHKIARNELLTIIPLLKKEWKLSFDFKATGFSGLQQVLHMTIGGKGTGSGSKYGDRTPAIWTHSSKGFLISSAVGGKYSFAKYFKLLPSVDEWTTLEISQEFDGSKMIYSITIGGTKVFSTTNSKPSQFENVKVYSSSDWYSPVDGIIKNLLIQNKNDGKYCFKKKTLN